MNHLKNNALQHAFPRKLAAHNASPGKALHNAAHSIRATPDAETTLQRTSQFPIFGDVRAYAKQQADYVDLYG